MAFLLFERRIQGHTGVLVATQEKYQLGGYGLIHQAWKKRGKPVNEGWRVGADELIRLRTEGQHSYESRRLVIDFDPKSDSRIGLIEILDVFAYTYGTEMTAQALWTPMMLRLRDVFYEDYAEKITPETKQKIIAEIAEDSDAKESIEFLYLLGDNMGWKWGRNGSTNAVFIQSEARRYFRQFF